jgi:hypothetical protein
MQLSDSEGRYCRYVIERDDMSNVHGKIIFRTAIRPRARHTTASTVVEPTATVYVVS